MKQNDSKRDQDEEFVIRIIEFMPLKSYYSVFKIVFERKVPTRAYVVDLSGIKVMEPTILGTIVLLKKHAIDCRVRLDIRNNSEIGSLEQVNRFLTVIKERVA